MGFPMTGEAPKVDTMNETELDKYTEDLAKFSETFQKELKNRVIKDGKKCIKLNYKWEFMIDSMLNAELSIMDFLEETNGTDVVEEKEAKDKEGEKEGEGKDGKEAEGDSAKKEEKEAKEEKGGEEKKEEGEKEKKEEKKEKAARRRNRRV